jgi:hypothetical protein
VAACKAENLSVNFRRNVISPEGRLMEPGHQDVVAARLSVALAPQPVLIDLGFNEEFLHFVSAAAFLNIFVCQLTVQVSIIGFHAAARVHRLSGQVASQSVRRCNGKRKYSSRYHGEQKAVRVYYLLNITIINTVRLHSRWL